MFDLDCFGLVMCAEKLPMVPMVVLLGLAGAQASPAAAHPPQDCDSITQIQRELQLLNGGGPWCCGACAKRAVKNDGMLRDSDLQETKRRQRSTRRRSMGSSVGQH